MVHDMKNELADAFISQKISDFLAEEALDGDASELELSTPLLQLGIIDSLKMLSLVSFIESTFGVEVSENDLVPDNFQSIEAITNMVVRLQNNS